jgi:predicted Zn-dependent protease with MMP-like domain
VSADASETQDGRVSWDVSPERFDELVSEAIDLVPDELAEHMDNVAILTADEPAVEQVQRMRRGRVLLGVYEGVNLTRRSPTTYGAVMPDRITIFRLAHCRLARDEDDLRRRVAHTVVHEIAHHFGISDARLRELGAY